MTLLQNKWYVILDYFNEGEEACKMASLRDKEDKNGQV